MTNLLEVCNLHVEFYAKKKTIKALSGVSFSLGTEEVLAIVGESGSGKSVTAKSILKLLPPQNAKIVDGSILYKETELTQLSKKEMVKYRGKKIAMVFQDPMTSLNPTMRIGEQIAEGLIVHDKLPKKEVWEKVHRMLKLVGIPEPEYNSRKYPHELSGGMRQRVGIAMALICEPSILIADEPTTALDVSIQAQIIELLKELQPKLNMSIILITHDLGIVANMADRILVMYAGEIVESGTVNEIFYKARHPYTWGLLQSIPDVDSKKPLKGIDGSPPDLSNLAKGCSFAARCPYVLDVCEEEKPSSIMIDKGHYASCWLNDERAPIVESPLIIKNKEKEIM
jgi:oligopeptide transport system ATP-binding protein